MSQSTSVPQAITIAVASARARPHPSVAPVDSSLPTLPLAPVASVSHQSILVRRARQHPSVHPSTVYSYCSRVRQSPSTVHCQRYPLPQSRPSATRAFSSGVRVNIRLCTRPVSHTDYIRRPSTETPLAIPLCPPHNSRQGRSPQNSHLVHLVPMASGMFASSSSTGSSTAFAIFMAAQAIGCIVLAFATGHSFVIAPAALVPIVYGWAAAATAAPYQGGVRPPPPATLHTEAPEARHCHRFHTEHHSPRSPPPLLTGAHPPPSLYTRHHSPHPSRQVPHPSKNRSELGQRV